MLAKYTVQSVSSFHKTERNWKHLIFLKFYRNSRSYRSTEIYTFPKQWHFNSPRTFHRLHEREENGREQVVCQDGADRWRPAQLSNISCLFVNCWSRGRNVKDEFLDSQKRKVWEWARRDKKDNGPCSISSRDGERKGEISQERLSVCLSVRKSPRKFISLMSIFFSWLLLSQFPGTATKYRI